MSIQLRSFVLCTSAFLVACGGSTSATNTAATTSTTASSGSASETTTATAEADAGTAATPPPAAEPTPPPAAPMAHVRVIHASPDPAAATVAIYLDGASTPSTPSLAFKAAAGYMDVPAGVHQVAVRPASAAATSTPVISGATPALEANHYYTVIADGLAAGQPALAIAPVGDDSPMPAEHTAHVRFFHAIAGMGAVDICMPGANAHAAATPVFANAAYGVFATPSANAAGNYTPVPAGSAVTLQVRAHNAHACTGALHGTITMTPPDRGVVTAVAVGHAGGAHAVTPELLVCNDAPSTTAMSSCTQVAIEMGGHAAAAAPAAPAAHGAAAAHAAPATH